MIPKIDLRKYQTESVNSLRMKMASGKKRVLLQASCGAGKTIISAEIVRLALSKGKKVLFLVHRRDLVKQTIDKYQQYGLGDEIGVIMAGFESELSRPVQVASLQTYGRRLNFNELAYNPWFHNADLVIFDECHVAGAPTYKRLLDLYSEKAYLIGLSATPCRSNGTGLGQLFDEIVPCIPMPDLVNQGFLVPAIHYAPSVLDMRGVRVTAGDYNAKDVDKLVDKPSLIGDVYENWARLAVDRQTIIFAHNVKHSKHIRDQFGRYGIKIAHIDANTPDEEREQIYSDFEAFRIQVLTNVGVCCEGSDLPCASCIVITRPTLSLSRWIQQAGRGARPYPGKENFLLLDHAGNIERHGYVDDDIAWTLDEHCQAAKRKKPRKKEKKILTCDECRHAFSGKVCPQCGLEVKDYGKKIEAVDAELVEVGKNKKKATMAEKRVFYGQLEYYRMAKGYSQGWSAWAYKEKFGVWPNGLKNTEPIELDHAFMNWIRYRAIKRAKSVKSTGSQQGGELLQSAAV